MKNKIVIIAVVAAVAAGAYFLLTSSQSPAPQAPIAEAPAPSPAPVSIPAPVVPVTPPIAHPIAGNSVSYTDSGYSPSVIKIKAGEMVKFQNQSSRAMWTASAVHPTHALYSGKSATDHCPDTAGTAFDSCGSVGPGGSWSFTFAKKGSWKYHNHLNPSDTGTIVVE